MPPAPVVVSKVQLIKPEMKSFVGSLVPIRTSTVGSAVDGRVVEILVDEGDPVRMESLAAGSEEILGQPIVKLRTVALDIELDAANVELETRKQAEAELAASLPTEIESATAVVDEIQARLDYSQDNYQRLKELADSGGGTSRREIDEAFSIARSQAQLIIAAKNRLKKLTATKEAQLAQARLKVEAQEAEVRRLQEQKAEFTIRAPFVGFVTQKNTELGQWVKRGDEVMEIIQLDPIDLVVTVPQEYIQDLQIALDRAREAQQPFTAKIDVESSTAELTGEVVQIVPQANLLSRSFPVKIRIKNPSTGEGHLLKSGMLATARMYIGATEEMLMVEKDALVLGGPQVSVYAVRPDPETQQTVAVPCPVQTGRTIGNKIQIFGDVKEGDQIVIEGNERLRPNQEVMIVPAMKE